MEEVVRIATRKSPLAMAQTQRVIKRMEKYMKGVRCELVEVETDGDRHLDWSLEKRGGKGLFTKELEEMLLDGRADIAVHSAKDLPTELPEGLTIGGYTERGDVRDMMVFRKGVGEVSVIATGSPRRREQLKLMYGEEVEFREIRGNVGTRLKKMVDGYADMCVFAAAGLERLGIRKWEGLDFEILEVDEMIPAVGQAAIALECRAGDEGRFSAIYDGEIGYGVGVERKFLAGLGGGCHVAYGGYYEKGRLWVFHEKVGYRDFEVEALDEKGLDERINAIVAELKEEEKSL